MTPLPSEVAALLRHGAVKTTTAIAALGSTELDRLLAAGRLRVLPGAGGGILVHPPEDDRWTAAAAMQLRCPEGAAACRLACWMFQAAPFDTARPAHLDFVSARRSRVARFTSSLPPCDVGHMADIRVTTPARTLADLGAVCSDDIIERVGERLLCKGLTTEDELRRIAERLKRRGRKGVAALERFLRQRGQGTPATESDLETRFLQASRALGFPEPDHRQYRVTRPQSGREPLRVDFAWRTLEALVLVEVDGAGVHANPDALIADLRRQNQLQVELKRLAPVLLRFTAADVDHQPRYIGDALGPWLPQTQAQGVTPHLGQPAA